MGASGKWLKSLIGSKKREKEELEKQGNRGSRKWMIWKNRTPSSRAPSEASDCSPTMAEDVYNAVIATIARAPAKDFRVVREEWAAIRIQTAFRGFLARRAFRALRAVVRLQAIFRGRRVRKQAAVTLRCMQALVRVQARIRARHVRMSSEGQAIQKMLDEHRTESNPLKQAEEGWCDRQGTLAEVKARLHMRQQGAVKRERTLAYSQSWRSNSNSITNAKMNCKSNLSLCNLQYEPDKGISEWSWLERWMAAKPWESRLMEQCPADSVDTPRSRSYIDQSGALLKHDDESKEDLEKQKLHMEKLTKQSEPLSVVVQKNNMTTRISARPPAALSNGHRSSARPLSSPRSELQYDESSASSPATTSTPISGNTAAGSEESSINRPSYMNLTESMKAKQKSCSNRTRRQGSEDFQQYKKSFLSVDGDSTNIGWS
ncbi:protein IQ-DOMAIN 6-like isoform X2 [Nymphaea colorata]|uniref:protein IQ-DOMAIN 6-like isoform X2 n=1 Tax=Nymphaea colorata TaxID=210225 RepID=UPI00129E3CC9|nr:protein IQ-DOMAIN 6-like isoform X2 [Nymphaea colorata]